MSACKGRTRGVWVSARFNDSGCLQLKIYGDVVYFLQHTWIVRQENHGKSIYLQYIIYILLFIYYI